MLWRQDAAGICRSSSHREMISSQLRGKLPNFGDFVEGAKKIVYSLLCSWKTQWRTTRDIFSQYLQVVHSYLEYEYGTIHKTVLVYSPMPLPCSATLFAPKALTKPN